MNPQRKTVTFIAALAAVVVWTAPVVQAQTAEEGNNQQSGYMLRAEVDRAEERGAGWENPEQKIVIAKPAGGTQASGQESKAGAVSDTTAATAPSSLEAGATQEEWEEHTEELDNYFRDLFDLSAPTLDWTCGGNRFARFRYSPPTNMWKKFEHYDEYGYEGELDFRSEQSRRDAYCNVISRATPTLELMAQETQRIARAFHNTYSFDGPRTEYTYTSMTEPFLNWELGRIEGRVTVGTTINFGGWGHLVTDNMWDEEPFVVHGVDPYTTIAQQFTPTDFSLLHPPGPPTCQFGSAPTIEAWPTERPTEYSLACTYDSVKPPDKGQGGIGEGPYGTHEYGVSVYQDEVTVMLSLSTFLIG